METSKNFKIISDFMPSGDQPEAIKKLIKQKVIKDGMIPKVNTAIDSIEKGVRAVVILDGSIQNACLLELFTDHGVGTLTVSYTHLTLPTIYSV